MYARGSSPMTPPPLPPDKDKYTDGNERPHVGSPSVVSRTTQPLPPRTHTPRNAFNPIMIYGSAALLALATVLYYHPGAQVRAWSDADVPAQAQRIYPKSFAVLDKVPPPSQANISTVSAAARHMSSVYEGGSLMSAIRSAGVHPRSTPGEAFPRV